MLFITAIAQPVKETMAAEFYDLYETPHDPQLNEIVMTSVGPWVEKDEELTRVAFKLRGLMKNRSNRYGSSRNK